MIPLPHPLETALYARVRLLAATLRPATTRRYEYTVRGFIAYLRQRFPEVRRPSQLRRDPHILGWLEHLGTHPIRSSGRPLATITRAAGLIRLRKLFHLLAAHPFPPPPELLLSQDIPRPVRREFHSSCGRARFVPALQQDRGRQDENKFELSG